MSSYDQNEDGRLNYQEFLIYMMDKEKKWKIDFHALDRNKCGKLSVTNIHLFCGYKMCSQLTKQYQESGKTLFIKYFL